MLTVEHHEGRLYELRLVGELTLEDFTNFKVRTTGVLMRVGKPGVVACDDFRDGTEIAPAVIVKFIEMLKQDNPFVQRVAFIVGNNGKLLDQMTRISTAANNPRRRLFSNIQEAVTWLDELLGDAERRRMRRFLRL